MKQESDADLLVYMTMAGDDPSAARAAWGEFYRRHAGFLYAVCLRAWAALLGGHAGACDLVGETFKRVYERAGTFDDGGIRDAEAMRLRVRAWLGRIAQRLALTALRSRGRLAARSLPAEAWQQVPEPAAAAPPCDPQRIARVRQALESLTEREQTVIRVTIQWYRPDSDHQRLPNDVAADLAETLGTTPENLRQIRRRAMKKIAAYLQAAGDGGNNGREAQ